MLCSWPSTSVPATRLSRRPRAVHGLHLLDRGAVYLPRYTSSSSASAMPLLVFLHGAGGSWQEILRLLRPLADRHGVALFLPQSARSTWDLKLSVEAQDAATITETVQRLMRRFPVLRADMVAIGGFSDGASYALSLALSTGSLFHTILAFSPGFARKAQHSPCPPAAPPLPLVFISHGTHDQVLSFERTSTRTVPKLIEGGATVVFVPFDGGHTVQPQALAIAMCLLASQCHLQL